MVCHSSTPSCLVFCFAKATPFSSTTLHFKEKKKWLFCVCVYCELEKQLQRVTEDESVACFFGKVILLISSFLLAQKIWKNKPPPFPSPPLARRRFQIQKKKRRIMDQHSTAVRVCGLSEKKKKNIFFLFACFLWWLLPPLYDDDNHHLLLLVDSPIPVYSFWVSSIVEKTRQLGTKRSLSLFLLLRPFSFRLWHDNESTS